MNEIAVAVVEWEDRFLIGLRPAGAPLAGYWEFPGGKLRPGETPAQAAARECLEETRLVVEIGRAYPTVEHDYDHGRLRLHFLAARPVDPQANPAARFRWVRRSELSGYEFPPANALLLSLLTGCSPTHSG